MPKRAPFIHKLLKRLDRLDQKAVRKHLVDLANENALFEEIFDRVEEGILLVSRGGKIRFANRQATLWLDIPEKKDRLISLLEVLQDSELLQFVQQHLKTLKASAVGDFNILHPQELKLRVFLTALGDSTDSEILIRISRIGNFESISAEEEATRYESLMRLASGVAHEIGNPLASIGIHLQLLKKDMKSLPQKSRKAFDESLGVLNSETDRLDRIVKNFLKATRKPPLRFRDENLNDILRDALSFMKPELEQRKTQIQFKEDKKLPSFLVDRARLYQVFINLIKNAMEAMPQGGGLRIQVSHKPKIVMLRFTDEGSGINESDLPYIFDAYYTTKSDGSGLGLLTVFEAVREHGGRIEVKSKVGQGTTFIILLPIRQPKLQLPEYSISKR